ncbi:MAG: class I SAM-dependent methyltransferase [Elusimicrobia bacterium]|nr:class I SAM-dependent methyltransferase [Elusimicrobiota bacterium]
MDVSSLSILGPSLPAGDSSLDPFKCAGCGHTQSRPLFRVGPAKAYGVVVCRSCGLAHLQPKPKGRWDGYQSADTESYAAAVQSLRSGFDHHHRLLLKKLSSLVPPPGQLLEMGCSGGDFLVAAKEAGYQVCGVEPAKLGDHRTDRENIHILNESVEQVSLPLGKFDLAVAIQVIEHMHDPKILCEKMAQSLKTGGVIYIETPNFGALARRCRSPRFMNLNVAPGHWHLFESRSLMGLLRRVGIEPVLSWTFFKSLSAYGRGPLRPAAVAMLNSLLGGWGLANTLAVIGRKVEKI